MTFDRRSFLKVLSAASGATLAGCGAMSMGGSLAMGKSSGRRVVVVGGGYGGTIAAKYIRMLDPSIEVVLVERNRQFVSCPFSNLYLGGLLPDLSSLTIGYDKLAANHGVKVVHDTVTAIDTAKKTSPARVARSATTAWCFRRGSTSASRKSPATTLLPPLR
jgi:sulfide dehydrogenase [flavocytochrome c] flavoprotein subunit